MREREAAQLVARARRQLAAVRGAALDDTALASAAVELAGLLLEAAEHERRGDDATRAGLLARLMDDARGQAFTTLLTDRVYRSKDPARVVDAARQLLRRLGMPRYLPAGARLQMRALLHFGPFAPGSAAAGLLGRLRHESRAVVLPAEDPALSQYLAARAQQGAHINVNHLGEAVLGEHEAQARVRDYVRLLERPDTEAISVKISSIFSQINLLAWQSTLEQLAERLRVIYRTALARPMTRADGSTAAKLVNLDMESYRDLHLTLQVFRRVLDEQEFLPLTAGLVLQAYLPDSAALQRELTDWARARALRGGAPVRLRIVKGANLLTERAESATRGLTLPVFGSKAEVDANYKRMLEYGCRPEHAAAVRLGIASHNAFDIAFGMIVRAMHGVEAQVGFELLEGMADPLRRVVSAVAGEVLLYAPVVDAGSMQTAIAYLMRRLDENTAEQNFLRHSFAMRAGDAAFTEQARRFEQAVRARNDVSDAPRRTQDRAKPAAEPRAHFDNEPDTDFALARNRAWIEPILQHWHARPAFDVGLQIGGEERTGEPRMDGFDPSRPGTVPYRFAVATEGDIERALATAEQAAARSAAVPVEQRAELLLAVAQGLREARGELIAAMVLDAGKAVEQADAEVSEAIDFAEYYARSFRELVAEHPELELRASGVVLVTPPWNFPLAIPAGGVLSALMAGNAVILKPALETVLVAERLAHICWAAGVARHTLQFVMCKDELGSTLIRDARVAQVVLTGATSTARLFHELRPGLALCAETGGKNAIIVSALSDRDEAIKDALYSAFGHAGQKCSACSLLVCEAEVYDDPRFMKTLADAAASLPWGSAWDARSVVTPLIQPPRGPLLRALSTLEPGESWLLEPQRDPNNVRAWSPGIKLGAREGGFTHTTELFGPVLAVMRADDLDHALRIANATPYGLTAGVFSLEEGEQRRWAERVQAGNLYVNRPITGAIVRRQPFGGYKASGFGPGAKAGGPNYVAQMTRIVQRLAPQVVCPPQPAAAELLVAVRPDLDERQRERLSVGACDYARAMRAHFSVDHDPSAVLGERNVFRYQPCSPMLLRAAGGADLVDVLLCAAAALSAGVAFVLSVTERVHAALPVLGRLPRVSTAVEDAAAAAARVSASARVRVIGSIEPELRAAAEDALVHVAAAPVLLSGRFELLAYHREQSLSHRFHRYGNLAGERLLPPLRAPQHGRDHEAAAAGASAPGPVAAPALRAGGAVQRERAGE